MTRDDPILKLALIVLLAAALWHFWPERPATFAERFGGPWPDIHDLTDRVPDLDLHYFRKVWI
jgi:hypothetical protein